MLLKLTSSTFFILPSQGLESSEFFFFSSYIGDIFCMLNLGYWNPKMDFLISINWMVSARHGWHGSKFSNMMSYSALHEKACDCKLTSHLILHSTKYSSVVNMLKYAPLVLFLTSASSFNCFLMVDTFKKSAFSCQFFRPMVRALVSLF